MRQSTKTEMISLLKGKFAFWIQARDFMIGFETLNGWYAYYEGESASDFSFCSKDPRGDDTGDHITMNDFNN